ncbi:MAG TPA: CHASE4 domain-containing protein [Chloroflexia bacterium]|nr:CHASE4 domain-containing protein [Chloroflexia bacterium]
MKIRAKTFLTISLTLLSTILLLTLALSLILSDSFNKIEEENSRDNVRRVQAALNEEITSLETTDIDWAEWDDSYNFVKDKNEEYIKSNLTDYSLSRLKLRLIVYANSENQLVYAKGVDTSNATETVLPPDFLPFLRPDSPLFKHTTIPSAVKGLVSLKEGPLLVVARPILTSDGKGPVSGTLIMARALDQKVIKTLSERTQFAITLQPYDSTDLASDIVVARSAIPLEQKDYIHVQPEGDRSIDGFTILRDITDKPVMLLEVESAREIYQQGQVSVHYVLLALLIVGLVSILMTFLILEKSVLSRLMHLSLEVKAIGKSNDFNGRVQLDGRDEVYNLSVSINQMLDALSEAQAKQQESEKRYRQLVELSPDAILVQSEGKLLFINSAGAKLLETPSAETLLGEDLQKYLPENQRNYYLEYLKQVTREPDKPILASGQLIIPEKGLIDVEFCSVPLVYSGQPATQTILRDITERKRTSEALRAEKERLDVTLSSISDGVIATDREGRVILINQVAQELLGRKQAEVFGVTLEEVFNAFDPKTRMPVASPVLLATRVGKAVDIPPGNLLLINKTKTEKQIEASVAPMRDSHDQVTGVVLAFRDITEKLKVTEELLKMGKLESLGLLAGGIAHDFNNLLTSILGYISIARTIASIDESDSKIDRSLEKAERACLKSTELTHQLLTFARGGAPIKKTASLKEIIEESVEFVVRGSNVEVLFALQPDLWPVEADTGQLSQVIQNLVINGIQAMPEGGKLVIEANNEISNTPALLETVPETSKQVKITIQDFGNGISQENLTKIFDPYFTTKKSGSGLGLAICHSIIHKHQGRIEVKSKIGEGTMFKIYLPASAAEHKVDKPVKEEPLSTIQQNKRVLVMDDDPNIRELFRELLDALGYNVEVTSDGNEAISSYRLAHETGHPFAAVIMDLTVPGGMGGKEAVQKLKEYDPAVKAIVCSGYTNDTVMAEYREYGFSGLICKPYRLKELAKVLEEVIALPSAEIKLESKASLAIATATEA